MNVHMLLFLCHCRLGSDYDYDYTVIAFEAYSIPIYPEGVQAL